MMPLELAVEAYARMMSAKARFRIVLVTGPLEESVVGERHLPAKHHRWREKRNEDCRGCRFGYLASISTHFAEKASRQSGRCHCGILARFSSHSESRLPLDLCRRSELKTDDTAERGHRGYKLGDVTSMLLGARPEDDGQRHYSLGGMDSHTPDVCADLQFRLGRAGSRCRGPESR
jgi:hypothetical protein